LRRLFESDECPTVRSILSSVAWVELGSVNFGHRVDGVLLRRRAVKQRHGFGLDLAVESE
jgi:hypothetical protein